MRFHCSFICSFFINIFLFFCLVNYLQKLIKILIVVGTLPIGNIIIINYSCKLVCGKKKKYILAVVEMKQIKVKMSQNLQKKHAPNCAQTITNAQLYIIEPAV